MSDRRLVTKDYFQEGPEWQLDDVVGQFADLDNEELLDLREVLEVLHLPPGTTLDTPLQPHGYRLLQKIPRLP